MSNAILAKSVGDYNTFERKADAAITPGMRLDLNSDNELAFAATQGLLGPVWIALENFLAGKNRTQAYAAGENVIAFQARPGDQLYVLVLASETIVIGTRLITNNAGKYIATTGTPAQTDFVALEASNVGTDAYVRAVAI